jgi:hypothetical protein
MGREDIHSSTESKCSSAITAADKERVIEPKFLSDLLLVLPLREYSIIPTDISLPA